ncbi:dysbindin-like isoform X2 [Paramormyrops kingsleyae]|uniref:dysbindin-like isoform X2 n=1 Tax=Paramormyrops kingsleyae TaxID=1676925 RepID=UPI000CD606A4|nr:dysbindin-like isoform X2 [Paramormyrops kingsleyae]
MTTSTGSDLHHELKPLETDHIQRVLSIGSEQHMRQQFCDKLFQQDLEAILSSSHLQIEPRRPLDSISSMEVNVDFLELTDHMDMFEQEALDIFLSSGGDESDQPSPLADNTHTKDNFKERTSLRVHGGSESRPPMLSISSASIDPISEEGEETPTQSDDEDEHTDVSLLWGKPPTDDRKKEDPACLM